jgi:polysaccharide deacetylase family protein (PEP-CTERM system associated)
MNILSVDVEDYFQVEALAEVVGREQWGSYASRVETSTRRLLDLFDETGARGTFFILGWVAERYPALVREIVARGHEPACHSYWHRLIYSLTPETFREDTKRAKGVIEDAAGTAIFGYRAPSYSITAKSLWALEVLAESGFTYDSSIFPIRHDVYGIPEAPRGPFRVQTRFGEIIEYPLTTFRLPWAGQNMPVGGGGYLRILPEWYTRFGVARARGDGLPLIVYVHPWEIDAAQPRIAAGLKSRFRHYTNLGRTEGRLRALLRERSFSGFRDSGLARSAPFGNLSSGATR